jgi:hypothetical protein
MSSSQDDEKPTAVVFQLQVCAPEEYVGIAYVEFSNDERSLRGRFRARRKMFYQPQD